MCGEHSFCVDLKDLSRRAPVHRIGEPNGIMERMICSHRRQRTLQGPRQNTQNLRHGRNDKSKTDKSSRYPSPHALTHITLAHRATSRDHPIGHQELSCSLVSQCYNCMCLMQNIIQTKECNRAYDPLPCSAPVWGRRQLDSPKMSL